MEGRVVLISIHPEYTNKIITGEKKVEFRRSWAVQQVEMLVIYATSPVQRIVAIVEVKHVVVGSPNKLWKLAKQVGGGITRRNLLAYLSGKKKAVGIEFSKVIPITNGLDPKRAFGNDFRPPQSFKYLKNEDLLRLNELLGEESEHNFCCGGAWSWENHML